MNKKMLKWIENELRKEDSITIMYKPTLEECDYLSTRGIYVTHLITTQNGLVSGFPYLTDFFTYSISK